MRSDRPVSGIVAYLARKEKRGERNLYREGGGCVGGGEE